MARWALGLSLCLTSACGDNVSSSRDSTTDTSGGTDLGAPGDAADTTNPGDTADPADLAEASEVTPDGTGSLETGEPCVSDEQCVSEWCVPSALGPICVPLCGAGCESGWVCIPASDSSSDPVSVCVPVTLPNPPIGDATDTTTPADTVSDTTTPADTVSDTTTPADTVSDTTTPTDTVSDTTGDTGSDTGNPVGDDDGDGIPNDEDNLPCLAIMLTIYNDGVASATVQLNNQEIVGSSAFPTPDPITVYINPVSGENTLALGGKLGGSPRDSLTLLVWDTQGNVYFTTVIVRQPGPPRSETFTFVVDASCP